MHCKRGSHHDEKIRIMELVQRTKKVRGELGSRNVINNVVPHVVFVNTLTDSPKKTISGLTSPLHVLHLGVLSSSTSFFISLSLNGRLHSMQRCVAKLPCASIILFAGTPARRSRVSMFCVKHKPSSPLSDRSLINECVRVGLYFPGYSSFASV
jgi:hypothetical protein